MYYFDWPESVVVERSAKELRLCGIQACYVDLFM